MQEVLTDLDFVKFFFTRSNYDEYIQHLDRDLLTKEPVEFINALKDFYDDHADIKEISPESFSTWFLQFKLKSHTSEVSKDTYKAILHQLQNRPATACDLILRQMKMKTIGKELLELANNKIDSTKLRKLTEEAEAADVKENFLKDILLVESVDQLFLDDKYVTGMDWSLPSITENVGVVPEKGFFGVIAARPGTSKSSLCIHFAVNFAKQLKKNEVILRFNNENVSSRMKRRAVSCSLNMEEKTITEQTKAGLDISAKYKDAIGGQDNILFFDVHNKDHSFIEKIVKHYKSSVRLIIIDMLDHVGVSKYMKTVISNTDAYFGVLYQWALGISCTYASVIGTSQISIVTGDQRYPKLENLTGSKTLKQGASSCQMMVGVEAGSNLRYITTPKNKYGKGGTTWHKVVSFETPTCQFKEI